MAALDWTLAERFGQCVASTGWNRNPKRPFGL